MSGYASSSKNGNPPPAGDFGSSAGLELLEHADHGAQTKTPGRYPGVGRVLAMLPTLLCLATRRLDSALLLQSDWRPAGLAGSAGGVEALLRLVPQLPGDLKAPILVVLHIGAHRSHLPELLKITGVPCAQRLREPVWCPGQA